jgi:flagellar biosynthesis component FlhA
LQQPQKWIYLTRRIEEVARNQGAHFYSSQDCYWKLAEIGKERQISFADLQNDPLSLASLSWVLKSLLSERVPIADFYSIAKEFQRCQARNLDLVTTVEEIRSLPKIRRQLPGNSQQDGLAIKALSRDLANRIHAAVDKTGSEPIFKSSPGILRDIRLLALQVKTEAGATGSPVLVTPPPIRPFARKMVADMDINVLSTREIIPPLLSQLKDSDATVPKQLRAAAGA